MKNNILMLCLVLLSLITFSCAESLEEATIEPEFENVTSDPEPCGTNESGDDQKPCIVGTRDS